MASGVECRMYEAPFPEVDDLVTVRVKSIAEMGAYVSLLEYGGREGMILLSELSRRRIRSINKLIRVGRQEVVMVLRVDKEKGYIDLSKRRVSPEDIQRAEDRFNKSKAVHSILRHVAENTHQQLEDLYTMFGWPLSKQYGHAYDAFMLAIHDPDTITQKLNDLNVPVEIQRELMVNVKRRLTPQPVKIRADIEATCFTYDGVDALRGALAAGEAAGTEACPVKITLVAPPLYVATVMSLDRELGVQTLQGAIEAVEKAIRQVGGDLTVKAPPRVVSDRDDRMLTNLMERLELANREVAGDDEDEDAEDDFGADEANSKLPGDAPAVAQ
eukprot:TRINITY_DN15167_c0_g1_i1.p1 TRINITY_DN15167_c0_g1~~TRINITY_DN15167_c0_g1_i1.p1  ORF type:complete len:329 (+),score=83.56 TRINITY_DN15167_c0_g1_i1:43-1029(+)